MFPLTFDDAPAGVRGAGRAASYNEVVEERNRRQNVIRLGALLCLVLTLYDGGHAGQSTVKQQQAAVAAAAASKAKNAAAGDSGYVRSSMVRTCVFVLRVFLCSVCPCVTVC